MLNEGAIKAGDRAPDFELPDADMSIVCLSDYLGGDQPGALVLFFYVRDDTPACTAEAIEFSDLEMDFARQGATVLGVSRDDCIRHGHYLRRRQYPAAGFELPIFLYAVGHQPA